MYHEIDTYNGKYIVREMHAPIHRDNRILRGRFHTRGQAQAWIDLQQQKQEQSYQKRKGHLHPELQPDIYGENLLHYP
jgi:hypothetical protein